VVALAATWTWNSGNPWRPTQANLLLQRARPVDQLTRCQIRDNYSAIAARGALSQQLPARPIGHSQSRLLQIPQVEVKASSRTAREFVDPLKNHVGPATRRAAVGPSIKPQPSLCALCRYRCPRIAVLGVAVFFRRFCRAPLSRKDSDEEA